MSTLIAIPAAGPRAPLNLAPPNRRLAWGLLVSLLLHALLLSLQFGIPGLRPGAGTPLSVVLAPPVSSLPPVATTRAPNVPNATATPAAPPASPTPAPRQAAPTPARDLPTPPSRHGFTLRDPAPVLPAPPTPKPAPPARRTLRRRSRPRVRPPTATLHTEVIARQVSEDPSFVLPQPELPALAEMREAPVEHPEPDPAQQVAQQADEEAATLARAEAERELAQQRAEEEAKRLAEQQLVAKRRAEELAELQRAQQLAEQRRAEDLARQQMAEQRRAEEQAQQHQLAEQRRAEELARQQLAEQQRARQLAEQRRAEELARQQLADQQRAQQLAEQRRAEELARQQLAEQQARQLAEQRQAAERAQQEAARQRAEELARQQAAEAEAAQRLARQAQAPGQPAAEPIGSLVRPDRGVGVGPGPGGGRAQGLPGADFGSRARELLRGIDVAKAVPPVMRAAEQAQQAVRRALADAARRDVPLRMYIDSVRQKIERNAVVSQAQLSSQAVHTDPVVSIAIRSDGSIDDVTILRSSGRPDIDEVVRRIVRLNARYAAFPPNVAANYDVIELRRIWTFAGVLRLVEEVR